MSVDAVAVLERLAGLGVSVTPRTDGNLYLAPASVIPTDLLELVRQHKAALLAHLTATTPDAARDRLQERLRQGQEWLTTTNDALCQQEHVWDAMRKRFADGLDLWDCMERQLRALFHYQGCIHGPGQRCPADTVVRCLTCAGGTPFVKVLPPSKGVE